MTQAEAVKHCYIAMRGTGPGGQLDTAAYEAFVKAAGGNQVYMNHDQASVFSLCRHYHNDPIELLAQLLKYFEPFDDGDHHDKTQSVR